MGRKRATLFDPKTFLTKIDGGKNILKCRMKQIAKVHRDSLVPVQWSFLMPLISAWLR